jgi:tripartite ATP-independent transporter DctM subunit
MIAYAGLALLLLVGIGIVGTGLPAAAVLICVSVIGAAAGIASGSVSLDLLTALPGRLINLLENDLIQALPLYVFMGVMINRLPIADALFRAGLAILPRKPSAPLVSGLGLGALLGPMNGSVGASVLALSRVVEPRLAACGIPAALRAAVIAVASTLGVVVPPSLVLILLGDAMLSAHTIAVTTTGRDDRVINTQDVFHSALLPAGLYLAACLLLAWIVGRQGARLEERKPEPSLTFNQAMLASFAVTAIVVLLAGVATGYFFAVEAAAMGAFALLVAGLMSGHLRGAVLRAILADTIALTGTLFFLLIAATTLTLILRIFGTDKLVAQWVAAIPGGEFSAVATVLAAIGFSALVLDAFEIIFVVIPIVIPPLLIRVADARWVAVLVLFTLQTSFLLPPIGYALMMVRGSLKIPVDMRPLLRALAPFLVMQWILVGAVLVFPQLTHVGEDKAAGMRKPAASIDNEDINRRLREMIPLPPDLSEPDQPPSR